RLLLPKGKRARVTRGRGRAVGSGRSVGVGGPGTTIDGEAADGTHMKRGTSRGASRRPTHPTRPIRVVHPITKLSVGGAQESVLVTCAGLPDREFVQTIVTGPEVD